MPSQRIKITLPFDPRPHQDQAHKKRKRFSVLVWHRRSGKTVFAIIELLMAAILCKKQSGRYAYIAPFYGQAKSVAWDYLKRYANSIPGVIVKEGELTIVLQNGATIRLFGADNPDALRGLYFDGIVLDEVAQMKPQLWAEIIRPALADRLGWALFIGTPKGLNLFSEIYFSALKDLEWYADLKKWSDTDAISKEEIEVMRRAMSPNHFAQEMECDFSAAVSNAIIPLELARLASSKKLHVSEYDFAPNILGVDVARFGDDRSVMYRRQGLASFQPIIMRGLTTMELASRIASQCEDQKPDAVFLDEIGVGAGVLDRLRQLGRTEVFGVNSGAKPLNPRYVNLRVEIWHKMSLWLSEGGILHDDPEIISDLCSPTYWFNSAEKMQLESVDDLKARGLPSPDIGSALAFTFAAPVQKMSAIQRFSPDKINRTITEYELFP